MPFKRYVNKTIRKGRKTIKKRYTTRTGHTRINRLAKDLLYVKRKLNTEHKHLDYLIGSSNTADVVTQYPTKQTPIILQLATPVKSMNFNGRIGNQIKITHITSKFEFIFNNNNDLIQRTNLRVQLLFAKNASDVPTIEELYELDSNGHYTPMSMSNTQEYGKFLWIKNHDHQKGYTQPTNRYPPTNSGGDTANPAYNTTGNVSADAVAIQPLNKAIFYSNKKSKENITIMFKNLSNEVEQMQPYLLLRSDVIDSAPNDYDPIAVTGIIRMTYVDN